MLCRAAARGKILKLTDFGQMLPKGQTLNGLSHTMLGEIDLVNGTLISGMHTLWGLKTNRPFI